MHDESMDLMHKLLDRIACWEGQTVLDCGSGMPPNSFRDYPTYRTVAKEHGLRYTGLDSEEGRNVDTIGDVYSIPYPDNHFDLVISGQLIEHLTFPLFAAQEMKRITKPGGFLILIAPRRWREHKYPVDCWRFLPDGMRFLLEGFSGIQADVENDDCYGYGYKPANYSPPWSITRLQ